MGDRSWIVFIADDHEHGALDGAKHHKDVKTELHVAQFFENWHHGPVQIDDGYLFDLVLGIYVNSWNAFFIFFIAKRKRNQLVQPHHDNVGHGHTDPASDWFLALLVVLPVFGEVDYGPENYEQEEEVSALWFWATHILIVKAFKL